jgi:hypothetical protein
MTLRKCEDTSHLKEEALDRTMWRARFGRGFGPVVLVRQTTKWMTARCTLTPGATWLHSSSYKQPNTNTDSESDGYPQIQTQAVNYTEVNHGKAWDASLNVRTELGVSSISTADAHPSAASSRLNWRLRRFKWTRPFRRKTKSGFCACAITFQKQSTTKQHIYASDP